MEWTESKNLEIGELKSLVSMLDELDTEAKAKDRIAKDAKAEAEIVRQQVISMLQESGLDKFHVPDVGLVSVSTTPTVKTPKSREEKENLFSFLREKGEDWFYTYVGVNSQSLNKLYKMELEKANIEGKPFDLPGVELGEPRIKLSFRRN